MAERRAAKCDEAVHRFPLRVPGALWRQIDEMHWTQRRSINQLLVEAIRKGLKEKSGV